MKLVIVKALALIALWMGATFGLQAQTVVEYIHTDALGTPVAVTNAAGTVIERSVYEPYGGLINRPLTDGPGFTGHVQDAATGLTYMQQRYYDPLIGRMLSVDPVTAYSSGDMRHFNVYAYVYNNPYKFTDPDGRIGQILGPIIIGGAICARISSCRNTAIRWGGAIIAGAAGAWAGTNGVLPIITQSSQGDSPSSEGGKAAPDLPTGLVGENPRATGKNGGEAVGTSLPGEKFPEVVEGLTGGTLGAPNDKGRSTAPNGVSVRTGGKDGPRIDIPANGTKPPEIIHFPENTPIPEKLKPNP